MAEKLSTAPKQRLSSPERRAAIVSAALQLFAERGFRGTTTRELAARVGVSEPVLYEHFRTKRDLYSAIIDTASQQSGVEEAERIFHEFAARENDRELFLHLANSIIAWFDQNADFERLLLFSALEGHELKDMFFERHSVRFIRMLSEYIARRIEAGAMRPVDPLIASRAFFGMILHYCISNMIFACARLEAPRETVASTMVDIFLQGVQARPESYR